MLVRPEDWRPQGVDDLEDRAWEALRETECSVCVTAGAGAGKTEFLAQKAAYLLQTGICSSPKRILAISFKRDAAATLRKRVAKRCPESQTRRFDSVTFDSFAKGIVDQFRKGIPEAYRPPRDYEISFPTAAGFRDFMQRHGIHGINAEQMENLIARVPLPPDHPALRDNQRTALAAYWREQYERFDHTLLTFDMINRLAEYLLRTNAAVRQALRSTYPFIFLDEFQDSTHAQFGMLLTAFDRRAAMFTAVGDDKQRIMGWAGAMPNAFTRFIEVVDAREINLLSNWRSHDELVEVQHAVAQRINPAVERVIAHRERAVDGHSVAIWSFRDRNEEVDTLAAWIAREIEENGMAADQFAILVRKRANDVEDELAETFNDRDIVLRNLARNVGGVAIQDTLVEPITEAVLPFLRLGAVTRDRKAWSAAIEKLRFFEGADESDDLLLQRINNKAEDIIRAVRRFMRNAVIADDSVDHILDLVISRIGEEAIRRSSYVRPADYGRVYEGLRALLKECLPGARGWAQVLDRFEGKGQVALMTVHKSKGMEFHTVLFFGLDRGSWGSLRPDNPEELNTFFVALTRAEQRAFFTCCEARGRRIDWLEEILGDGAPRIVGSQLLDA
ncbi:UvrD-helicase domain-containing protein [Sinorhizobium meliloti]|uniref:UvrD-helicase domain-containing protein n=1 Tax=Rhizobium meliloti TaxID=382 RepID=UPI003F5CEA72